MVDILTAMLSDGLAPAEAACPEAQRTLSSTSCHGNANPQRLSRS
jgi:hypothetical protein